MTSDGPCREVRQALAVYVLGAIGPADRSVIDRHLARCPQCRDQLAGLAGLPGLLRKVDPGELAAVAAEESGGADGELSGAALGSLLSQAARARRRGLRIRVAAAIAAGVIAGVTAMAAWRIQAPAANLASASVPHWPAAVRARDSATHASAVVRYAATAWGLSLSVRVSGISVGTACELEVAGPAGQRVIAGGWTIAGPNTWYPGSASMPLSEVRSFVVSAGSRVLVVIPLPVRTAASAAPHGPRSW